jgi:ERCC4-related helicase
VSSKPPRDFQPAPGSRVRVRGEEWAVHKSLPLDFGGFAVHVQGVSELVRYHQAIFLTPLDEIELLRPEETRLVTDPTPEYRQTRLYLETLLRRMPPTDDQVHLGHRGALDVLPYQLVPAKQGLEALRPRLLIADGTGLGKTVELGILLTELIHRGRGRRILVVAIRSMLAQLQRELWARFTLPLVRLDSEGLFRVQSKIPANRNPFSYFDRCIISIDTLKNDALYRAWLEQARWDVIVVDECHNVAGTGSQRAELARLLATQCDALVMTSATPHNGRSESFANLMRMLDPTSIADPTRFAKDDVKHLFVRRFKKDVAAEVKAELRERNIQTLAADASPEEEAAFQAVHALRLHRLGRKRGGEDALLRWTLVKALGSSPAACLETLEARIKNTEQALATGEPPHPFQADLEADLSGLRHAAGLVGALHDPFRKLERLIEELKAIGFDGSRKSVRAVIFSERIATLELLERTLTKRFQLGAGAIALFTAGSGDDQTQREIVESFGRKDSDLRLLLCSDAASEGINLHHQCHHLFHFDVPWSLIRLTQRNGRIDRYGQHHTPHLFYLLTRTRESTADQRVIDRLIEKEREVERQLGDAGALLGLYQAEDEDDALTRGVARGVSAEELIPDQPAEPGSAQTALARARTGDDGENAASADEAGASGAGFDLLALLTEVEAEQAKAPALEALTAEGSSLFGSDWEFLTAALRHLESSPAIGSEPLRWEPNREERTIEVHAPEPFRSHIEPFLPREALPVANAPYRLVERRDLVQSKLRAALDDEGRWPEWHLLWQQHPLVDWLLDALGSAYTRLEAPLLRVPSLGSSALFLLQGLLYNHESEAVAAEWLAFEVEGATFSEDHLDLTGVNARVGLDRSLVNPGKPSVRQAELQALVPAAVKLARERLLLGRQQEVQARLQPRARRETRRLERWEAESLERIHERRAAAESRGSALPRHLKRRLDEEEADVRRIRKNHDQLLDSLKVAPDSDPFVRLVAVFCGT